MHGEGLDSDRVTLGESVDNFEQGEKDSFTITLPSDIGTVKAITIGEYGSQHLVICNILVKQLHVISHAIEAY